MKDLKRFAHKVFVWVQVLGKRMLSLVKDSGENYKKVPLECGQLRNIACPNISITLSRRDLGNLRLCKMSEVTAAL